MNKKDYVDFHISRREHNIYGHAVGLPYIVDIGNQETWVVDVMVDTMSELLLRVPIAENNRQVRNFVNDGSPLELRKSNAGQFFVSGLSAKKKGNVHKKVYKIDTYYYGFTEGFKLNASGNYESGNGNEQDTGTEDDTTYYYVTTITALGDLDFGVTPLEHRITVRMEV